MKKLLVRNWTPISYIICAVLVILFVISIGAFWWQGRHYQTTLMVQHLNQLAAIFKDIEATAGIVNFDHQINYIDFLNVKKFKGSTLGSMNLRYPDRWRGPYVTKNPTIQEQYYQIVESNQGYFITPGNGVRLANGKTVGTDIDLRKPNINITQLAKDPNQLNVDGFSLAISLQKFRGKDVKSSLKKEDFESTPRVLPDPYDLLEEQ